DQQGFALHPVRRRICPGYLVAQLKQPSGSDHAWRSLKPRFSSELRNRLFWGNDLLRTRDIGVEPTLCIIGRKLRGNVWASRLLSAGADRQASRGSQGRKGSR